MARSEFRNDEAGRRTITMVCGLELTRPYCEIRVAALTDGLEPATRSLIPSYGRDSREMVREWFRRAGKEALS